jgi:uncharacterized protein (TIGR02996 family)
MHPTENRTVAVFHRPRSARTTLTNPTALLATVLANPADDTSRLVLADMLRESDDPEEQTRGRFLWGAVTTTRYTAADSIPDEVFRTALNEVNSIIEEGYPARWLSKLGIGPRPLIRQDWRLKRKNDRYAISIGASEGVFTRGMLSELFLPLGEWYELGENALVQWPLERIQITDVPGLIFTIRKTGDDWELEAGFELENRGVQATDTDPGLWVIRESYPDRESLTLWLTRESESLVHRLYEMVSDQ